jgi:UDP-N-acetylglucosamine acyltransferase
MAYSHVGHDCRVGDNVVIANGCLVAGHCSVGNRVFLSGNVAVHQFARIGRLAMIGGLTRVNSDVPPFMTLELDSTVRNVNLIGIQRAGFTQEQVDSVRQAYRILYHSGLGFRDALDRIEREAGAPEAMEIVEFCRTPSKRPLSRHYTH